MKGKKSVTMFDWLHVDLSDSSVSEKGWHQNVNGNSLIVHIPQPMKICSGHLLDDDSISALAAFADRSPPWLRVCVTLSRALGGFLFGPLWSSTEKLSIACCFLLFNCSGQLIQESYAPERQEAAKEVFWGRTVQNRIRAQVIILCGWSGRVCLESNVCRLGYKNYTNTSRTRAKEAGTNWMMTKPWLSVI